MTSLVTSSWIKTSQCFPPCYCRTKLIETCYPTLGPASLFATHVSVVGMVRWAYQPCHSPLSKCCSFFPRMTWFWSFYLFVWLNLALNVNPCWLRLLYESENIHPFCPLILLPREGHIFIPWSLWHGHVTCFCMYNESRNVSAGVCSRGCRDLSVSRHHATGGRSAVQHADSMYLLFPGQCRCGAPMPLAWSRLSQTQPNPPTPCELRATVIFDV